MSENSTPHDGYADEPIPEKLRDRIVYHGEHAPWHQEYQQELGENEDTLINSYEDIETWGDLREAFGYVDDDDLLELGPEAWVPDTYDDDELVESTSSATTSDRPKEIYWHVTDLEDNIDYVEEVLREQGVPTDTHWVGTATPNKALNYMLNGAAEQFDGELYLEEVDPAPVKRALMSGDEEQIGQALGPIAAELQEQFQEHDVKVYEDIAPLMTFVGEQLSEEKRENVELLMIGGVGTTEETVEYLTEELFPNATLTGWYGDYMTGLSMMKDEKTLTYVPQQPDVQLDVRDPENLDEPVAEGEDGYVVATAIREGFFVPNRIIGDKATHVLEDGKDGITNIGRIPEDS